MRSTPARTRLRSRTSLRKGRYTRSAPLSEDATSFDIAVDATLRSVALRTIPGEKFSIQRDDLREKVRTRPWGALTVFLVDASESMATRERMAAAKGAVLSMLAGAYVKRERVALVAFHGEEARVLLPPTSSIALARDRLRKLPACGATPFAAGLCKAREVIRCERIKDPGLEPLLVIVSDGSANVPMKPGGKCLEELISLATALRRDRIHSVAIDTRSGPETSGCMIDVAEALGAKYFHIDHLRTPSLMDAVRESEK